MLYLVFLTTTNTFLLPSIRKHPAKLQLFFGTCKYFVKKMLTIWSFCVVNTLHIRYKSRELVPARLYESFWNKIIIFVLARCRFYVCAG